MTDHTAHIEECERAHMAALSLNDHIDHCAENTADAAESLQWAFDRLEDARLESERWTKQVFVRGTRDARAKETDIRARLHAYGVDCPVEACEDGHILIENLAQTSTSPAEPITEHCEFCEGRGMVLPAQADAHQGD